MRLLVTGSRNWTNIDAIQQILEAWWEHVGKVDEVTLISGACPTGADTLCEQIAEELGWTVERHPADWKTHGKKAGFLRNSEMVNSGPDYCIGFVKDGSKGATMTINLAKEAGIPTFVATC